MLRSGGKKTRLIVAVPTAAIRSARTRPTHCIGDVPPHGFATIHVPAIAPNTTPIWLGSKPRSRNNNARKGEKAATEIPISAKSARTDIPARISRVIRTSRQPGNEPRGVLAVYLAQLRVRELEPEIAHRPCGGIASAEYGKCSSAVSRKRKWIAYSSALGGKTSVPKHTRSGCSSSSRRVARGCRPSSAIRAAMSTLKFGYVVSIRETHERSSA